MSSDSWLVFSVELPEDEDDLYDIRDTVELALWEADLRVGEMPYLDGVLNVPVFVRAEDARTVPDLRAVLERAVPGSTASFVRSEDGPPAIRALTQPTSRRYVNTWISEDGVDRPCDAGLRPDTDHDVLVRIGEHDDRSLFDPDDAEWRPSADATGFLLLTVVLSVAGTVAAERPLRLPADGPSSACGCPEVDHTSTCLQNEWVRLPFHTSWEPGQAIAAVQICRGDTVLHAQQLVLTIGPGGRPVPSITTDLTPTFDVRIIDERPRTASLHLDDDQVLLRSSGASYGYRVRDRGVDRRARILREALDAAHFEPAAPGKPVEKLRTRFGEDMEKSLDGYATDLLRLAQAGGELFTGMFDRWAREALRSASDGAVADLQITGVGTSGLPVLWPLLYDIPLSGDAEAAFHFCASVAEFGPDGSAGPGDAPASCPHRDTHGADTICPYGFWGLSHHLEQIPACRAESLTRRDPGSEGLALSLIVGPRIPSPALLKQHADRLILSRYAVERTDPTTRREVADALAGETTVACLLSHCGYQGDSGVYLDYGQHVFPNTVDMWQECNYWSADHWTKRRPLVVLNGCHTMHATSGTLARFVERFVESGASGVIGSEVLIAQDVACWAVELLLAELAAGREMAAAVRSMRWTMLRRGNVMGLAYSPYCLVDQRYQQIPSER